MSRRRQTPMEEFLTIASSLPWWAGLVLAAISFLILHQFADLNVRQQLHANQAGNLVIVQMVKTFAFFGQFIVPIAFLTGSLVSARKHGHDRNNYRSDCKAASHRRARLNSILIQEKSSPIATFFFCILVVFTTVVCLAIFHNSSGYQTLLAFVFIFSAAYALWSTLTEFSVSVSFADQLKKQHKLEEPLTDYHHNKSKQDEPVESEWIAVNDPYKSEVRNIESYISLDEYLEMNNYILKDEIIETIEWNRFELLCCRIFEATGFRSEMTGFGPDEGVDIRIYDTVDPVKVIGLVQCKHTRTQKKYNRLLLQQLRGQMAAENAEKGWFCATSGFTKPAKEFAAANNIELFDKEAITRIFDKLDINSRRIILKEVLSGDYWTPSCASCGQKFKPIQSRYGKMVWGCTNSGSHGWSSIHYYEASPIENVR